MPCDLPLASNQKASPAIGHLLGIGVPDPLCMEPLPEITHVRTSSGPDVAGGGCGGGGGVWPRRAHEKGGNDESLNKRRRVCHSSQQGPHGLSILNFRGRHLYMLDAGKDEGRIASPMQSLVLGDRHKTPQIKSFSGRHYGYQWPAATERMFPKNHFRVLSPFLSPGTPFTCGWQVSAEMVDVEGIAGYDIGARRIVRSIAARKCESSVFGSIDFTPTQSRRKSALCVGRIKRAETMLELTVKESAEQDIEGGSGPGAETNTPLSRRNSICDC